MANAHYKSENWPKKTSRRPTRTRTMTGTLKHGPHCQKCRLTGVPKLLDWVDTFSPNCKHRQKQLNISPWTDIETTKENDNLIMHLERWKALFPQSDNRSWRSHHRLRDGPLLLAVQLHSEHSNTPELAYPGKQNSLGHRPAVSDSERCLEILPPSASKSHLEFLEPSQLRLHSAES